MDWLPEHNGGLYLEHNDHKSVYQTVEQWDEDRNYDEKTSLFDWISEEERQKAIKTDSVWRIQWYPNSPIGFCSVAASSIEALKEYFEKD